MLSATPRTLRPLLVSVLICALFITGLSAMAPPSRAQTTNAIDIRFVQVDGNISAPLPTGGQFTQVIIQNTGPALTATPVVIKFASSPSVLQFVTENGANVGVIDKATGSWYHTLPTLGEGRSVTFLVNWYAGCAGKWPLAARVGERRVSTVVQYVGQSFSGCPPDETVSPAPPAYYDLAWPPTPTTVPASTLPASSTVAGASTQVPASTVAGASTQVPATTIAGASTVPGVSTDSTTTVATTTIPKPTTTRPPTTKATAKRPTTTVEIVCKTISGRRYCGPKSSALKKGQAKPREVKPVTTRKKK